MAISKVKLPDNTTQDIKDSRIQGVDSTPTANSQNVVTSGGAYSGIHPAVITTQPSGGFVPNVLYRLGTLTGSITFTLASPSDSAIENEYHWSFTAGNPAPTITWPTGVEWVGDEPPTINAGQKYEISILDGVGGNVLEPASSGGGSYTLPIASASGLGGIKVGSGLSIDSTTGVLSATGGSVENVLTLVNPFPLDEGEISYTKSEFEQKFCSFTDLIAAANGEYSAIQYAFYGTPMTTPFGKIKTEENGVISLAGISFTTIDGSFFSILCIPLQEQEVGMSVFFHASQLKNYSCDLPDPNTSSADLKLMFEDVWGVNVIGFRGGDGGMMYVPITTYIDAINGTNFNVCEFTYKGYNYSIKCNNNTDVYSCTKTPVPVKVTSLSAQSTDNEYPSAKCVYDLIGDVETLLEAL